MAARVYIEVCGEQYGKGAFSKRWSALVESYEAEIGRAHV